MSLVQDRGKPAVPGGAQRDTLHRVRPVPNTVVRLVTCEHELHGPLRDPRAQRGKRDVRPRAKARAERAPPMTPQDLTEHNCINVRLRTYGGLYPWEFEKDGRELKVRVEGQLIFNTSAQVVTAALGGFGLAYIWETSRSPTLLTGVCTVCWKTGVHRFRATISTTQVAGNRHRRLLYS
jgi:hypothetical protein